MQSCRQDEQLPTWKTTREREPVSWMLTWSHIQRIIETLSCLALKRERENWAIRGGSNEVLEGDKEMIWDSNRWVHQCCRELRIYVHGALICLLFWMMAAWNRWVLHEQMGEWFLLTEERGRKKEWGAANAEATSTEPTKIKAVFDSVSSRYQLCWKSSVQSWHPWGAVKKSRPSRGSHSQSQLPLVVAFPPADHLPNRGPCINQGTSEITPISDTQMNQERVLD